MKLLCIDYGTRRIGVAFAATPIAEPLRVISNVTKSSSETITPHALQELLELIEETEADRIIVGISEERMAEKTRDCVAFIEQSTSVPIEYVDETLSSVEAYQGMRHMKKSKREGDRDHYAAATILQNYIDSHAVIF